MSEITVSAAAQRFVVETNGVRFNVEADTLRADGNIALAGYVTEFIDSMDWSFCKGDWFYVSNKESGESAEYILVVELDRNDTGVNRRMIIVLQKGNSFADLTVTQKASSESVPASSAHCL